MEKKRYLSITLAMCLVFSILSGCGGQAAQSPQTQAAGDAKEESRQDGTAGESPEDTANQASGDTILIGVSGSITGEAPINGLRTKQGAQMAADEINAAGGVLGRQIELFVADDGGAQDTAINAANLIISQDVAAQVGPNLSGMALAVEGLLSQARVPMLTGATSPKLVTTIDNPYLFRIRAADTVQAKLAATYATQNLGCKKLGLFTNSNDYGSGALNVIQEYLDGIGTEYVAEAHNTGDTDMTSQILKLKDAGVDGVIIWTDDAETALAARQFHDLGLDVPIIGSPSISTPQVSGLCQPQWLDNWYCVTDFTASNTSDHVTRFVKDFEAKYNETPELYAATYYGSIYILKDAIERAGTTESDALLKALNETDNLQGVVGKYKPNSMREMVHEGIICKLEDGTAVYLDSITVED